MRRQVHVAVPGEHRPARAPGRQPARTGRRPRKPAGSVVARRPRPRRRTACGTAVTREPSEVVPSGNSSRLSPAASRFAHHVALAPGRMSLAGDEHSAPEAGDGADDWPPRHLVLGHEAGVELPAQHRDVEPGGVVGDEHHRPPAWRTDSGSDHPHLEPEQATGASTSRIARAPPLRGLAASGTAPGTACTASVHSSTPAPRERRGTGRSTPGRLVRPRGRQSPSAGNSAVRASTRRRAARLRGRREVSLMAGPDSSLTVS